MRPYSGGAARIAAIDITQDFHSEIGSRRVLDRISFSVAKGDKLAILGRNGAGKSTLIRILSGLIVPSGGEVIRTMSISWPLALGGQFEGRLTGYDNIRFIAKLYGADVDYVFEFVEDFSELGAYLKVQTRFYSSGMLMRLAFALSLAIDFGCILVDEVLAVGDERFQLKCQHELFNNRAEKAMIIATHSAPFVENFCNKALVLKSGQGRVFDDVKLATRIYSTL